MRTGFSVQEGLSEWRKTVESALAAYLAAVPADADWPAEQIIDGFDACFVLYVRPLCFFNCIMSVGEVAGSVRAQRCRGAVAKRSVRVFTVQTIAHCHRGPRVQEAVSQACETLLRPGSAAGDALFQTCADAADAVEKDPKVRAAYACGLRIWTVWFLKEGLGWGK